ncbi:MAG TPA: cell division protein FtsA [Candidatus Polarisedimenticolia bacterium]|jgi:cell division protein FtsA|nr:cell division protein FtsA [Candidatus Polarisedimenticolia bacterium]
MARPGTHIVGLDIGTTKVSVLIAEPREGGAIDIIGLGSAPSRGMRKGVVVNLDSCVGSIKQAVEEAELVAGCTADRAFVGVAGAHVRGLNSRGVISIPGRDREVTRDDVDRVLASARAVNIPPEREIFHVLPQEFMVDDQDGIHDPAGMTGTKLQANVHIVTASVAAAQNLVNSVNRAGVEVEEIVLEQLAAADAVLTPDEKEMGVALIDIGAGTTDLVIFERGAIRHIAALPTGGEHVTNDIAVGLRTPIPEAERIKKKHGCALASLVGEEDTVEVPTVGGRKPRVLSRTLLCEIIQPRVEEIFALIAEEFARSAFDRSLHAGIVLTGGGSMLEGIQEVAERTLNMPVRRGAPVGLGGLAEAVATPQHSTVVGLAMYGARQRLKAPMKMPHPFVLSRMGDMVKGWLSELF